MLLSTGNDPNSEKGGIYESRPDRYVPNSQSRAAKRGCFKRGGFPIWTCPSFFVLFCPFGTFPGIFPICSGMVRGFSRFVLFLCLGLLRAPTRNSPERVRDTIRTCPEKSGKHPGLETPRFSFSQLKGRQTLRRGFKQGGFPIWTCPSFFVISCPFWDFPDLSGDSSGIFPMCPFPLSRPINSAYEEQSRKSP